MTLSRSQLVALVDHTLLRPEATRAQIVATAEAGRDLGAASVCVNGLWVAIVADVLRGSAVRACSVVGFPLGAMSPTSVADETVVAIGDGAEEIDLVLPIGLLRAGDLTAARSYVAGVRRAAGAGALKVILETAALTEAETVAGCEVAVAAGADFVKTSTGFHAAGGATVDAVRLMRTTVGPDVGVKASGGIRTLADARAMVDAGADRLGLSGTAAILDELGAAGSR